MTVPTVDARNENVVVLLDWARNELANARSRLEAPNMQHDEAQLLRGKIAVLKGIRGGMRAVYPGIAAVRTRPRGVPRQRPPGGHRQQSVLVTSR